MCVRKKYYIKMNHHCNKSIHLLSKFKIDRTHLRELTENSKCEC